MNHAKTFTGAGDFEANYAAEAFLQDRGFSVGRMQGPDPRGILFDNYNISKWRNMNASEIKALHGCMKGDMRHGPVHVEIFTTAPTEAKEAFAHEREIVRVA